MLTFPNLNLTFFSSSNKKCSVTWEASSWMCRAGRPWKDLALAWMCRAGGAREARTRPRMCGAGGGAEGGAGGGAGEAQGGVWV